MMGSQCLKRCTRATGQAYKADHQQGFHVPARLGLRSSTLRKSRSRSTWKDIWEGPVREVLT